MYYILATDIATSMEEDADYTYIAVALTKDNKMIVLDCLRQRFEGPDILSAIKRMIDKHQAGWVTMERQGFQLSLIQMAKRQGMRVKEVKPDKDKVARALTLSARMESGDVYFKGDALGSMIWKESYLLFLLEHTMIWLMRLDTVS